MFGHLSEASCRPISNQAFFWKTALSSLSLFIYLKNCICFVPVLGWQLVNLAFSLQLKLKVQSHCNCCRYLHSKSWGILIILNLIVVCFEKFIFSFLCRTILLSVISLLNEPNTFSPANVDASVMFRKWRDSKGKDGDYERIVK